VRGLERFAGLPVRAATEKAHGEAIAEKAVNAAVI
jgi:hypothetical protein